MLPYVTASQGEVEKRREAIRRADTSECGGPQRDPREGQLQCSEKHILLYATDTGAQRHAHPNLLFLPRHRIRDNTVDTKHRQQQAEPGKYSNEQHEKTAGRTGSSTIVRIGRNSAAD